jgi:hypothetical protein
LEAKKQVEQIMATIKRTTRTSATVYTKDLELFRIIARLKFDKDPMNNAWMEAVKLFNEENKDLFKDKYEELKE